MKNILTIIINIKIINIYKIKLSILHLEMRAPLTLVRLFFNIFECNVYLYYTFFLLSPPDIPT